MMEKRRPKIVRIDVNRDPMFAGVVWYSGCDPIVETAPPPVQELQPTYTQLPPPPPPPQHNDHVMAYWLSRLDQHNDHVMKYWMWRIDQLAAKQRTEAERHG